jgi:hypothetical protein
MGSLGTPQFIVLLAVVAAAAALCGFIASTLARSKKRHPRRFFMTGFFCGFTAGVVVRRRWRDIGRLATRALGSSGLPVRLGLPPRRPRRLPMSLLTVRR